MSSATTIDGGGGGAPDVRNHAQAPPLASQREANRGGSWPKIAGALFPLSYKEGFSQWWAAVSPAVAEHSVLSFLPFNNIPHPSLSPKQSNEATTETPPNADPYGSRTCTSTFAQLSGKDRYLNEFSVTRIEEEKKEDLVILHGYGAGLGFFYRNFDALSRRPGWKIYALDLLGYGRSSRPPFKIHATDKEGKIREAEDWFIDSLEEWRKMRGIDRFTLIGHSLGGYLAAAYALKYPGRLKKLILASPVGIPEDPYAVKESLPTQNAGENASAANEFLQAQSDIVASADNKNASSPNLTEQTANLTDPKLAVPQHTISSSSAPVSASSSTTNLNSTPTTEPSAQAPRRPLPKWITYLWDANISPFSLVRWSGPFGPRLVSGWTSRRFSALPPLESEALHNYAYSLFRQRGSGEYALAYILAPGAFARSPLLWRIGKVGVPTVLMYGDMDWMDVSGGFAARDRIREEGRRVNYEGWMGGWEWTGRNKEEGEDDVSDGEVGGGEAKVVIIGKAGHHLYLDGWEEFNECIMKEMEDVEERERRRERLGGGKVGEVKNDEKGEAKKEVEEDGKKKKCMWK